MKNYIGSILDRIERFKESKPRTYKLILISLWIIAPVEMLSFTLAKKAIAKLGERHA